jgi:penicillin-binding protein A
MMEPRLVREVRSPDGVIIDKPTSRVHGRPMGEETAGTLTDMMEAAVTQVESGAAIPGVKVAGKTGTAEAPGEELHSWFISFAPADDPEIAVAVMVENGQEGYKQALPIARRLMEEHLRSQGELPSEAPSLPPAQPQGETTQPGTQPARPQNEGPSQFPFQNPFRSPNQNPAQNNPGQLPGQSPNEPPGQPPNQRPGG